MVRKRAHIKEQIVPSTHPSTSSAFDDYDVMTSSTMSILSEAESELDTSGGSCRSIAAGGASLGKASSPHPNYDNHHHGKTSRKNESWYSHILTIEDLVEVDPARGKFIYNLQELVTKKQTILAAHELSPEVSIYCDYIF